ncbi:MBOAT family O-acyltransferase [Dyadobacter psychrophilus]|uniref:D-alanyl-lipoteichoic acid acyltransferase DltB, MBOAT superfamily n=1 Tax=Dyadobacter psychrophilus TaxID=651661 RepID=A0A1T5GK62_9BACT|nr:MBOAT family O-acyltransferase [Dyadobacter psychrophilus]SKC08805.1 D-alanyl-lipoteichoic acid acyltransferase DltB, MBOAT superfamily [Dyadobacter psychrophilus]
MVKFTDFTYFLLLFIIVAAYYNTPQSRKWILLLVLSVLFNISWSGYYVLVWFALTTVCFFGGRYLANPEHSKKQRKTLLAFLVIFCLAPLVFFKYLVPINNSFSPVILNWLAPIGISYYTFLIIGYLTDVHRKYIKPEPHFGYLALYLGFFPTMLAGPLERARQLIPQLKTPVGYDPENIKAGIFFIVWGLFKKMVLAARFADHVNPVFDQPEKYTAFSVTLAILLFSIQLYCDFSGYCDIATGSARLLGIRLSKNFANRYYFTPSRTESWNSWNITVTSWFRDYVFFNISKGVTNKARLEFNRLLTFIITGLWHGPSLSFVIWGFLQWAYINFEIRTKRFWERFYGGLGLRIGSNSHTVMRIIVRLLTGTLIMGWFRAAELENGLRLYSAMFGFQSGALSILTSGFGLTLVLFLILDLINYQMGEKEDIASFLLKKSPLQRNLSFLILAQLVLIFGQITVANFYYIQF